MIKLSHMHMYLIVEITIRSDKGLDEQGKDYIFIGSSTRQLEIFLVWEDSSDVLKGIKNNNWCPIYGHGVHSWSFNGCLFSLHLKSGYAWKFSFMTKIWFTWLHNVDV